MNDNKTSKPSMFELAESAAKDAADMAIRTARFANTPVIIWRDGKVVSQTPDEAQKELEELRKAKTLASQDVKQGKRVNE